MAMVLNGIFLFVFCGFINSDFTAGRPAVIKAVPVDDMEVNGIVRSTSDASVQYDIIVHWKSRCLRDAEVYVVLKGSSSQSEPIRLLQPTNQPYNGAALRTKVRVYRIVMKPIDGISSVVLSTNDTLGVPAFEKILLIRDDSTVYDFGQTSSSKRSVEATTTTATLLYEFPALSIRFKSIGKCINPLQTSLPTQVNTPLIVSLDCGSLVTFFTITPENCIQHLASGLYIDDKEFPSPNEGTTVTTGTTNTSDTTIPVNNATGKTTNLEEPISAINDGPFGCKEDMLGGHHGNLGRKNPGRLSGLHGMHDQPGDLGKDSGNVPSTVETLRNGHRAGSSIGTVGNQKEGYSTHDDFGGRHGNQNGPYVNSETGDDEVDSDGRNSDNGAGDDMNGRVHLHGGVSENGDLHRAGLVDGDNKGGNNDRGSNVGEVGNDSLHRAGSIHDDGLGIRDNHLDDDGTDGEIGMHDSQHGYSSRLDGTSQREHHRKLFSGELKDNSWDRKSTIVGDQDEIGESRSSLEPPLVVGKRFFLQEKCSLSFSYTQKAEGAPVEKRTLTTKSFLLENTTGNCIGYQDSRVVLMPCGDVPSSVDFVDKKGTTVTPKTEAQLQKLVSAPASPPPPPPQPPAPSTTTITTSAEQCGNTCPSTCYPSCTTSCCSLGQGSLYGQGNTVSTQETGTGQCGSDCSSSCYPSCSQSCCGSSQGSSYGQGTSYGQGNTMIQTGMMYPQGQSSCPSHCKAQNCQSTQSCPQSCCQANSGQAQPMSSQGMSSSYTQGQNSCPSGCKRSCHPSCPFYCC